MGGVECHTLLFNDEAIITCSSLLPQGKVYNTATVIPALLVEEGQTAKTADVRLTICVWSSLIISMDQLLRSFIASPPAAVHLTFPLDPTMYIIVVVIVTTAMNDS